jgi:uncharacterized protein YigE (DUF2233 family)
MKTRQQFKAIFRKVKNVPFSLLLALFFLSFSSLTYLSNSEEPQSNYDFHTVNPAISNLSFHWKNNAGEHYGSIRNLQDDFSKSGRKLTFAMNGGMYKTDRSPLGLYIEEGKVKSRINRVQNAYGNFYMQPNGVFILDSNKTARVIKSSLYKNSDGIAYATQSGPMLLIEGKVHPAFRKGSKNLNIRNGVGILPNGSVLFAISKVEVNFYDFAQFLKKKGMQECLVFRRFCIPNVLTFNREESKRR